MGRRSLLWFLLALLCVALSLSVIRSLASVAHEPSDARSDRKEQFSGESMLADLATSDVPGRTRSSVDDRGTILRVYGASPRDHEDMMIAAREWPGGRAINIEPAGRPGDYVYTWSEKHVVSISLPNSEPYQALVGPIDVKGGVLKIRLPAVTQVHVALDVDDGVHEPISVLAFDSPAVDAELDELVDFARVTRLLEAFAADGVPLGESDAELAEQVLGVPGKRARLMEVDDGNAAWAERFFAPYVGFAVVTTDSAGAITALRAGVGVESDNGRVGVLADRAGSAVFVLPPEARPDRGWLLAHGRIVEGVGIWGPTPFAGAACVVRLSRLRYGKNGQGYRRRRSQVFISEQIVPAGGTFSFAVSGGEEYMVTAAESGSEDDLAFRLGFVHAPKVGSTYIDLAEAIVGGALELSVSVIRTDTGEVLDIGCLPDYLRIMLRSAVPKGADEPWGVSMSFRIPEEGRLTLQGLPVADYRIGVDEGVDRGEPWVVGEEKFRMRALADLSVGNARDRMVELQLFLDPL